MNSRVKKIVFLALLATVSVILSYVESLLPPLWAAVPGIKLGLPNIIILSVLYSFSLGDAATVSFVRIAVTALLFGNPLTLAYSAAGAALSLLMMALCKRLNLFSVVGVSVVGGISHNLGQILLAIVILETSELGYYMAVLAVTGTVAGVFTGLAGVFVKGYLDKLRSRL